MARALTSIVATLVLFGLAEGIVRGAYLVRNSMADVIPLPYGLNDEVGPMPPWLDDHRILARDPELIWTGRPRVRRRYLDVFSPVNSEEDRTALVRQFLPRIPRALRQNPEWTVSLNSSGFRGPELRHKAAGVFRIVCLGDSWTFGANVALEDSYPSRLERLVQREWPSARVEVVNLGVLGYTSYQGLTLMKRVVRDIQPDVVLIAFGMNDSSVAGWHDSDVARNGQKLPTVGRRVRDGLERLESYKLLRYVGQIIRYRRPPLTRHFETAPSGRAGDDPYAGMEGWTRVTLDDYERNIRAMIAMARSAGASVALVFNELWLGNPYRQRLAELAGAEDVPFVDSPAIIDAAKRRMQQTFAEELGLDGSADTRDVGEDVNVVFRVYADDRAARRVSIVGPPAQLGNLTPNMIAMYDDATHGDQRAGDHVWSYSARFAAGTRVRYVYTTGDKAGRWRGLDVPYIRDVTVDRAASGRTLYLPIDWFGKLPLQADGWHTDATGYQLIAEAVFRNLKDREPLKHLSAERNSAAKASPESGPPRAHAGPRRRLPG